MSATSIKGIRFQGRRTLVVAALLASATLSSERAYAQDATPAPAPAPAADTLQDIVVTAEKRSSTVQKTPIAITALDQIELDRRGITDVNGLQTSVPNFSFTTQTNFTSGVVLTIRGVGTNVIVSGADPGVALHMDGIYMGQGATALLSFYDLQRIEVLRGPQGTLYGRNATGGSVNIVGQDPVDAFEAKGDLLYGNYDRRRARAAINVPLGGGAAVRVSGTWEKRDGYIDNLVPGQPSANDKDEKSLRAAIKAPIGDAIDVTLRGYYSKSDGTGSIVVKRTQGPVSVAGIALVPPGIGIPTFLPIYAGALPTPTDLYTYRSNLTPFLDQENYGGSATIEARLGFATLKSVTGYFKGKTSLLRDGDGTELNLISKGRDEASKQFSQEFDLSSSGSSRLKWIVGALYFEQRQDDTNTFVNVPANPAVPGYTGINFNFASYVKSRSYAFFGQLDYALTDRLTVVAGARYSVDRKEGQIINRDISDATTGVHLIGYPQTGGGTRTWKEPTWKFGLNYQFTPRNLLYASYSRGYKSGGLNINDPVNFIFNPEYIDAFEAGSKNRFADGRVELNVSAFLYKYRDLQLFKTTLATTAIENAAKSTIYGIEFESRVQPVKNLTLNMSATYLRARIDDFTTIDSALPPPLQVTEDLAGNQLPHAPKMTLDLGARYALPVGWAQLVFQTNYHWQDDVYFRPQNKPLDRQPGYGLLDASIALSPSNERWSLTVFGRNLTNKHAIADELVEAGLFGSPYFASVIEPRTYGVEVGFKF